MSSSKINPIVPSDDVTAAEMHGGYQLLRAVTELAASISRMRLALVEPVSYLEHAETLLLKMPFLPPASADLNGERATWMRFASATAANCHAFADDLTAVFPSDDDEECHCECAREDASVRVHATQDLIRSLLALPAETQRSYLISRGADPEHVDQVGATVILTNTLAYLDGGSER